MLVQVYPQAFFLLPQPELRKVELYLCTKSLRCVPLAGIISSASVHDSQAAIPLAKLTAQRVQNFYDLMDAGYYAEEIIKHSQSLGHVPIIEKPARCTGEKEEKTQEKMAWKTLN